MDYTELAKQMLENMRNLRHTRPQKDMSESMQGATFIMQYLLERNEAVLPSEISNFMGISTARIAAALNKLEDKGYIEREIDKSDRRQILVTLTQEGRAFAGQNQQEFLLNTSKMLAYLGEDDAKELIRIMKKIANYHP